MAITAIRSYTATVNDTAVISGNNGGPHHKAAIRAYEEGSITVFGTVTAIQSSGWANGADYRQFTISTSRGQFSLVAFSDMKDGIWEASRDVEVGQKAAFLAGPEAWGSNKPRWQGTRRICGVSSVSAAEHIKGLNNGTPNTETFGLLGHQVDLRALKTIRARQFLEGSSASWKRFANTPEAYLP